MSDVAGMIGIGILLMVFIIIIINDMYTRHERGSALKSCVKNDDGSYTVEILLIPSIFDQVAMCDYGIQKGLHKATLHNTEGKIFMSASLETGVTCNPSSVIQISEAVKAWALINE